MSSANTAALQRLALLQTLATQAEDQAARQLADALAKQAMAADRHSELLQYESEYAARAPSAGSVLALTQHAGCLAKLREALRFQAERVQNLSSELEQRRARWLALHREVEKLEQLGAATRQQIAAVERRRQARENDEIAQRGWALQRAVG